MPVDSSRITDSASPSAITTASYHTWPHSPSHLFRPKSVYMVTAGTHYKKPFFHSPERRSFLQSLIFQEVSHFEWKLQAWAVMPNHYHFIAQAPESADTLAPMIRAIHSKSARRINGDDNEPSRQVWFQYWDSCITFEKSYYARLHYVHTNPAKHGFVQSAEAYPWCSMRWFLMEGERAFVKTVLSFKCERIQVRDDF